MKISKQFLPKAVMFGVASAILYALLFAYADDLVDFARRSRQGEKVWFIVPIVIAFVFSYVHGTFTGYFWDVLGLKPAQKDKNRK